MQPLFLQATPPGNSHAPPQKVQDGVHSRLTDTGHSFDNVFQQAKASQPEAAVTEEADTAVSADTDSVEATEVIDARAEKTKNGSTLDATSDKSAADRLGQIRTGDDIKPDTPDADATMPLVPKSQPPLRAVDGEIHQQPSRSFNSETSFDSETAPRPEHSGMTQEQIGDVKRDPAHAIAAIAGKVRQGEQPVPASSSANNMSRTAPLSTVPAVPVAGSVEADVPAAPTPSKSPPPSQVAVAVTAQTQAAHHAMTLPTGSAPAQTAAMPQPAIQNTAAVEVSKAVAHAPIVAFPTEGKASLHPAEQRRQDRLAPTTATISTPNPIFRAIQTPAPVQWSPMTNGGQAERESGEHRLSDVVFSTGRTETAAVQTHATLPARTDLPPQTLRQLADAVMQMPNRPVEITLSPKELGRVRMAVNVTDTGVVVSLMAERPETLDLMRRNIDQLGQDLQSLGFDNVAFAFDGSDADAQADAQDGKSGTSTPHLIHSDETETPMTQVTLRSGADTGLDLRL